MVEVIFSWSLSACTNRKHPIESNAGHQGCATRICSWSISIYHVQFPLEDTVNAHNLHCMIYADDTQLYITFNPNEQPSIASAIECCIVDIKCWMSTNMLMLNDSKTEIIHLHSRHIPHSPLPSLHIGESNVEPVPSAKNLGVFINKSMIMSQHVSNIYAKLGVCGGTLIRRQLKNSFTRLWHQDSIIVTLCFSGYHHASLTSCSGFKILLPGWWRESMDVATWNPSSANCTGFLFGRRSFLRFF